MTGGVRLKDISIRGSGAAGAAAVAARRCKKRSMRARVCPPRSASLCLFGSFSLNSRQTPRSRSPGISYIARTGGSWGVHRAPSDAHPRFAFFYPRSHLSPLTPSDGGASRPRRGPQQTKATKRIRVPSHVHKNFPILIFFCLPGSKCRSSDLSINLHFRGSTRARQQEQNTLFPVTRPQSYPSHKTPSVAVKENRAQGALSLSMALLSTSCACTALYDHAFVFPRRRPRSTFAEITTCRYHLPTSIARHMDNTTYMPTVTSMVF
jgi:hypothetical protein